jgi:hypothetical protein
MDTVGKRRVEALSETSSELQLVGYERCIEVLQEHYELF